MCVNAQTTCLASTKHGLDGGLVMDVVGERKLWRRLLLLLPGALALVLDHAVARPLFSLMGSGCISYLDQLSLIRRPACVHCRSIDGVVADMRSPILVQHHAFGIETWQHTPILAS